MKADEIEKARNLARIRFFGYHLPGIGWGVPNDATFSAVETVDVLGRMLELAAAKHLAGRTVMLKRSLDMVLPLDSVGQDAELLAHQFILTLAVAVAGIAPPKEEITLAFREGDFVIYRGNGDQGKLRDQLCRITKIEPSKTEPGLRIIEAWFGKGVTLADGSRLSDYPTNFEVLCEQ